MEGEVLRLRAGHSIDSCDNAWDYKLMPANHAEFLEWYFRPEVTADPEKKEWAERCIRLVPEELHPSHPIQE